ncbi:Na+/H+ antiporter subunit E, partial [candidate division KSB1 bacterium]
MSIKNRAKSFLYLFLFLVLIWLCLTSTFNRQELFSGIFISLVLALSLNK